MKRIWRLSRIFREYKQRRVQVRSRPFRLWIETAACCNLRCDMCPNKDYPAARKGLMSLELFQKIIDEARGFVSDVYLHHRGEPLLNPALFDMIRYARVAGIKTRFHTNGTLLNEEKARRLLEVGPNLVSFSIDGFTKASYERVRVGANFEQTVANVLRLAALRRQRNLRHPYIVVEKIRFRKPETDADPNAVHDLYRRFREAGVDEIIEKAEYTWAEESAPECTGVHSYAVCTFPWYAMVICWDGTVTPCPQDFQAFLNMGNVTERSLKEIWNDNAYQQLRRQLATDIQALTLCRKCDRLARKTIGGVPWQYMTTFLTDHLLGYGPVRKWLGTHERN